MIFKPNCYGFIVSALALILQLLAQFPLASAAVEGPDGLLQNEVRQGEIRDSTSRVADGLKSLLGEFELNGLAGEELRILRSMTGILGKLSSDDMGQVIASLQQARSTARASGQAVKASDAFAGQRGIIFQLQQLLAEYERQQALQILSARFEDLAARQNENLKLTIALAGEVEKSPSQYSDAQRANRRYQEIQQETLKEEAALGLRQLNELIGKMSDAATVERLKPVIKQTRETGAVPALESATASLKAGKLFNAAGSEKKARDELRLLARKILQGNDPAERLKKALAEVSETLESEEAIVTDTTRARDRTAFTALAERQQELGDTTDLVKGDIADLAPAASELLKQSAAQMRRASAALAHTNTAVAPSSALEPEKKAVDQLKEARAILEKAFLAEAAKKNAAPPADLQKLAEKIKDLQRQEEKIKSEAATGSAQKLAELSARQKELREQAQAAAAASSQVPPAAQSLNEAAAQMQQSETALAGSKNQPTAQQGAIDALKKAGEEVRAEINRQDQARQQLQKMEALRKELAELIASQQKLQVETAKHISVTNPPTAMLVDPQKKIEAQGSEVQSKAAQLAPKAVPSMAEARNAMKKAQGELQRRQPEPAASAQGTALDHLFQARQTLETQMAALSPQSGKTMPPGPKGDSAGDKISRAQALVNQALTKLPLATEKLAELAEQQKELAQKIKSEQGTRRSSPLVAAGEKAREAASQIAAGQLTSALTEMKSIRKSLEQAQTRPETPSKIGELAQAQGKIEAEVSRLIEGEKKEMAATTQAAVPLVAAGEEIAPLTSGEMGELPPLARISLQAAESSIGKGMTDASAGKGAAAKQNASNAAEYLAQAKAALSLARAGFSPPPGQAPGQAMEAQGQAQGQGNQPGQGKGQSQTPAQVKGEGSGNVGNWAEGGSVDGGVRRTATGTGRYLNLPARERAALEQSQREKYSPEYAPAIEQYLKNLSDEAGKTQNK